ncbi:MAG TPA: FAD-dependent monooxygenase [Candidatus Desulfobacillus sp.]|nr:FAD-dependent monooxygenase [Candidatus Desulfobacillus sp.]
MPERAAGTADGDAAQVAIVGGGPLGLALALMLRRAGIDGVLLDARPAGAAAGDARVLALSHGSRQILERLGAWAAIGATPITTIHVSQQGAPGRTLIEAADAGVPALGYTATAGQVAATLARACGEAGIALRHETRVVASEARAQHTRLDCVTPQGKARLEAQLVAWAEGAVDGEAGVRRRDYGQQALVARVRAQGAPTATAWERFTPCGPVALLPLADHFGLVWSTAEGEAAALLALDEKSFLERLAAVFAGRFAFTGVEDRAAFPLGLRWRESPVAARAVWLGNAAQTLHPVAGQGFNLALRDAAQLARLLAAQPADCGAADLLARHAAARRRDRRAGIGFTDGLVRLFGLDDPIAAGLRGVGLLALDLLPAARRLLARRMIFGVRA